MRLFSLRKKIWSSFSAERLERRSIQPCLFWPACCKGYIAPDEGSLESSVIDIFILSQIVCSFNIKQGGPLLSPIWTFLHCMHFWSKPIPSLISEISKKQNLSADSMDLYTKFYSVISNSRIHVITSWTELLDMPVLISGFCTAITESTGYFDMNSTVLVKVDKISFQY